MATPDSDVPFRSVHPLTVAVELLPRVFSVVRNFWPLFLAAFFGRGDAIDGSWLFLGVIGSAFGGGLLSSLLHVLTFRYRLVGDRLELLSGLFDRQVRVLSIDRIQNVETLRTLPHRLLGLVDVRVETAVGEEAEGHVNAIPLADGDALVAALRARSSASLPPAEPRIWSELSLLDLVRYGASTGRAGAAAVVMGLLFERLGSGDSDEVRALVGSVGPLQVLGVSAAALVAAWWISIGTAVVRFHGFRVEDRGPSLAAEGGLFSRRRVELAPRRIQQVTVRAPWLSRWLGFVTVAIETAGARTGGGTERSEAVLPVVERAALSATLGRLVPAAARVIEEGDAGWQPLSLRALRRAVVRAYLRAGLLTVAMVFALGPWGALAALAGPLGHLWARVAHARSAYLVGEGLVGFRSGVWQRSVHLAVGARVMTAEVVAGPFDRMRKLAAVVVTTAGGRIVLPAVDAELAWDVAERVLAQGRGDPVS